MRYKLLKLSTHFAINFLIFVTLVFAFFYQDGGYCDDGLFIGSCVFGNLLSKIFFVSFGIIFVAITSLSRLVVLNKGWLKNQAMKQFIAIYIGGFVLSIPTSIILSVVILYLGYDAFA